MLRDPAAGGQPWRLYDFCLRTDHGAASRQRAVIPWWTDPDFRARFLRPVTSLSIWLDYRLYDRWAPGYHLTSLALFAILLLLMWRLFARLVPEGHGALWTLAFFALDDVHVIPVDWIANRNMLLAVLFGAATLVCVQNFLRARRMHWMALAGATLVLACLSKESAIGFAPVATALLVCQTPRPEGMGRLRHAGRVLQTWPARLFIALAAGFLAVYIATGHGATSVVYPTPWHAPLAYLTRQALLFPAALLSLWLRLPAEVISAGIVPVWLVAVAGVTLAILFGGIMARVLRGEPRATFAVAWFVCALATESGGELSDRLFMSASAGMALLAALFITRLPAPAVLWQQRRLASLALAAWLILAGTALPVGYAAWLRHSLSELTRFERAAVGDAEVDLGAPDPRDVCLINSPTSMTALSFTMAWRLLHDDFGTRVLPLQLGRADLNWTRVDERTVEFRTRGTQPLLEGRIERVLRTSDIPLPPGTRRETPLYTATVLASDAQGVRRVRLEFSRPVDHPSVQFLAFIDGRFRRVRPPAMGEVAAIPSVTTLNPLVP